MDGNFDRHGCADELPVKQLRPRNANEKRVVNIFRSMYCRRQLGQQRAQFPRIAKQLQNAYVMFFCDQFVVMVVHNRMLQRRCFEKQIWAATLRLSTYHEALQFPFLCKINGRCLHLKHCFNHLKIVCSKPCLGAGKEFEMVAWHHDRQQIHGNVHPNVYNFLQH